MRAQAGVAAREGGSVQVEHHGTAKHSSSKGLTTGQISQAEIGRWQNASVIPEPILERTLFETLNAHQFQVWIRSPLRMFGAEIFSVPFLKEEHLPSDHEWPWDEKVLSERHVCQKPLFLPVFF